ncbi:hypothetical protein PA905_49390 [Planktothrix agardhii CCAP 1459/11A]|uniref:Uncharacterized protein n=1 Tax=Planktothrix agardhii CCAP 1459/11A TaxID=282420 RepID=A0A479ZQD4_PLAAG|nr:hypothetical protein [Planktothrix agardhii]GCL34707.1 hypothetical protein PA905_49390 [Planktothrix agardhii CCAP 1459/11A]
MGSGYQQQLPYFINSPKSPAQAVVTAVSGETAQLWLAGIDLRKVTTGTIFTAINSTGKVKMISRDGLVGQAKIEQTVTVGTLLHLIS